MNEDSSGSYEVAEGIHRFRSSSALVELRMREAFHQELLLAELVED